MARRRMTKVNQIYKCETCGNIVELTHNGSGELVCCGQPMKLMTEQTEGQGLTEKHRPIIEPQNDGALIKIGAVLHPMTEEHFIEWVEIIVEGKLCRYSLSAGNRPEVRSYLKNHNYVRAYCNIHGLWKN